MKTVILTLSVFLLFLSGSFATHEPLQVKIETKIEDLKDEWKPALGHVNVTTETILLPSVVTRLDELCKVEIIKEFPNLVEPSPYEGFILSVTPTIDVNGIFLKGDITFSRPLTEKRPITQFTEQRIYLNKVFKNGKEEVIEIEGVGKFFLTLNITDASGKAIKLDL